MLEEWKLIHPEHYGEELDYSYWHTQRLYVAKNHRGKGAGKSLLKQAETWAKKHRGHEVFLFTGKNWTEKNFYLKLGYQTLADVPKFYSKVDFVLMRKFID